MLDYLDYLRSVKHISAHTLRAYRKDLTRYFAFLTRNSIDPARAGSSVARSFIASLSKEGLSSRSINRVVSAVRGYYRFGLRHGRARANPFDGAKALRAEKWLPTFLFEAEAERILAPDASRDSFWALRDLVIFEFLYSTGCRVSEAVAVDTISVDLERTSLKIVGKGGKHRTVFLGKLAVAALKEYLLRRGPHVRDDPEAKRALFINRKGARITERGVRYILDKHLKQLGIDKRVTPHTFRHSFATHVLNRGADIRVVQELLGHSSLSTTQVYTHLGLEKLRDTYLKAHPHA